MSQLQGPNTLPQARFEDDFATQCRDVYVDLAQRYITRFVSSVNPDKRQSYLDRFDGRPIDTLAECAATAIKYSGSARRTDGFLVELDRDKVQIVSRRMGGLVVTDFFADEIMNRQPWPELSEPYAGMSPETFRFAVADEYATDIVRAAEHGITHELVGLDEGTS